MLDSFLKKESNKSGTYPRPQSAYSEMQAALSPARSAEQPKENAAQSEVASERSKADTSKTLNTGESVRFGAAGLDQIPISRAIQASTALPGLYPPVEIDGHAYADGALLRTMHASLVLDEGADLVICINPLVAYDASAGGRRRPDGALTQRGLSVVLGQTFRSLIQSRMQVGMAGYHSRYPASDILLFEPDRDDERMFFANVFRYADRRRLVDHAYQRVRADLRRHADTLDRALGRHGLRLRREVLRDPHRSFHASIEQQRLANARVTRDLDRTLRRLEQLVGGAG